MENSKPKPILQILIMAFFVESITTYIKCLIVDNTLTIGMLISILIGICVSICYDMDLPKQLGIDSKTAIIGNIITGILISRGSNYLYDFISIFYK